ncbi:sugar transferase [Marinigracilibium pacificum]|uniref:Sugar transferase n=1 Tax=Marinigracilibium pacificum TaxID=2729599 RepID=A0A848J0M8_9BACT|nr:sugar transferase [Marinigracilibium pacificum]NMM48034.1 sugar transferase [Marinigracilibium pacificum]
MYRNFFKRILDFSLSFIGLVLLAPIILVVWILLAINQSGKAFFVQPRPGKNGKVFNLIKFKTMSDERDDNGELLPDEIRLHGMGRFVRKTSLDELPQLINVLKGDMSIIGPRPLLVEYLPLYNDIQARRHEVRPGITGWAQVNGRNAISWERKFDYDVYYVDNLSFVLDIKILILTIKKVFVAEGISSNTSVTMEKFKGSEN